MSPTYLYVRLPVLLIGLLVGVLTGIKLDQIADHRKKNHGDIPPDAKVYTNCGIESGSKYLTCLQGFSPANKDQTVVVHGAGPGGQELREIIVDVLRTGIAVLEYPAYTTVLGEPAVVGSDATRMFGFKISGNTCEPEPPKK